MCGKVVFFKGCFDVTLSAYELLCASDFAITFRKIGNGILTALYYKLIERNIFICSDFF